MGIYLGQLPPAEVARLKAELAETLIASFCYPRFYDYRTGTLRMRPVDRSKRQEVWLYLSSFDFTAWNRIDLMSPEFQYQIERLFIQFVQRNRSFFGNQGRKRMSDIRLLIGTASVTVAEDLRSHLTGRRKPGPPFGSPRSVPSWTTTNVTGLRESNWEQMAPSAILLQQQLQEVRGEIKSTPQLPTPPRDEPRQSAPASASASKRPVNGQTAAKVVHTNQQDGSAVAVQTIPVNGSAPPAVQAMTRNGGAAAAKSSGPLYPPKPPVQPVQPVQPVPPASVAAPAPSSKARVPGVSVAPITPIVPTYSSQAPVNSASIYTRAETPTMPQLPQVSVQEEVKVPSPTASPASASVTSLPAQERSVSSVATPAMASVAAHQKENEATVSGGEDVAIFEQLRHQMLVWLRVEAVHCGIDISGQSPANYSMRCANRAVLMKRACRLSLACSILPTR